MLQQTQVDRVTPKYAEWLEKYPTIASLADAELDEVKDTWKGLGYNIRPVRLHSIARETVQHYGGELPQEADTLRDVSRHRTLHCRCRRQLRVWER